MLSQREIKHQQELLEIHECNLDHYRRQANAFGSLDFSPPIVRHGIKEAEDNIARIITLLEKHNVQKS